MLSFLFLICNMGVVHKILFISFFNIYSLLRDKVQAGEGQGERETRSPKQAPGSELSAQSPIVGIEHMNSEIMT